MQIALVAVVLLAGMWFTVLKPKSSSDSASSSFTPVPTATTAAATPAASTDKVAPGVKGLVTAVDKAKAASATSDAANAKIQAATGTATTAATSTATAKAKATATATKAKSTTKTSAAASAKSGTKTATKAATTAATAAKAKTPATDVDPSDRLLAYLAKDKVLVVLFYGNGVEDRAARKAVHRTAQKDPKHVVSAYVPISKVGDYEAITSDVQILASPTILVIGKDSKATALTGYVDVDSVRQAVGDARRAAVKTTK
jgi:endonuclease I